jgi:hypothetical protein
MPFSSSSSLTDPNTTSGIHMISTLQLLYTICLCHTDIIFSRSPITLVYNQLILARMHVTLAWQLVLPWATLTSATLNNGRPLFIEARTGAVPTTKTSPYNTMITTCASPGMVALTYDDGPGHYTDELLSILSKNGVKATFFVNGDNNNGPITKGILPSILRKVYARGHHIGSHTWSHANLTGLTREQRWQEMDQLQDALSNIIGITPTYMRPPYFECPSDCLRDMSDFGFHVVRCLIGLIIHHVLT